MHVDEGKEGTIHQNSWYHWYNARNGDALVRGMEPMARFDHDDADERRTGKRTDTQPHVETDVAVRWTQIDEIAEAYGDDTAHSYSWQQTARYAEDGREAHGRYGSCDGKLPVFVMRSHRKILHKVVDVANLDGEGDTESHREEHQQGVQGTNHSHLNISVEHIAYKVDEWNSRHDEEGTRHQRMPRGI